MFAVLSLVGCLLWDDGFAPKFRELGLLLRDVGLRDVEVRFGCLFLRLLRFGRFVRRSLLGFLLYTLRRRGLVAVLPIRLHRVVVEHRREPTTLLLLGRRVVSLLRLFDLLGLGLFLLLGLGLGLLLIPLLGLGLGFPLLLVGKVGAHRLLVNLGVRVVETRGHGGGRRDDIPGRERRRPRGGPLGLLGTLGDRRVRLVLPGGHHLLPLLLRLRGLLHLRCDLRLLSLGGGGPYLVLLPFTLLTLPRLLLFPLAFSLERGERLLVPIRVLLVLRGRRCRRDRLAAFDALG